MSLAFEPLEKTHFPLLLKWLEAPHVKAWWDPQTCWTPERIEEKYAPRLSRAKTAQEGSLSVQGFVFFVDGRAAGYCQYYDARLYIDIPAGAQLPASLAGIDFFLGEKDLLQKGIGQQVLEEFLKKIALLSYDHVLVAPQRQNVAAVKLYEKGSFHKVKHILETDEVWMIR